MNCQTAIAGPLLINLMSRPRLLLAVAAGFLVIVAGLVAGVWWYLFGTNEIDSAELVPANTVFFASIPNAATLLEGYATSQAKTLLSSPNAKPAHDYLVDLIGQKNIDVLHDFLPNLSGQSFIAVTHFDYDHPEKIGLIAAMKPKAGLGDFGSFLDKVKSTWPDVLKQGKTGTGTVEGVNYDWIQGPGAPDKICVAQVGGWIVTTWGEASLQDWIERFRHKSDTSSLGEDMNYKQSIDRVGDDPMTLLYVNCRCVGEILQQQLAKANPAAGDYLAKKLDDLGGAAIATRFENGEIVDRFSFCYPRPAQFEAGLAEEPCPFDTLKFTGPDTRFYWASSVNWKQYARNIHEQTRQTETINPMANHAANFLEDWTRGAGLDTQRNIVDALGSEISVQVEWPAETTWPEVGMLVKIDKPEDFKATTDAIINTVRQQYAATAVVKELNAGTQNLASLQFMQTSPISPTITEDGSYLGIFLTSDQATRTFQRDNSGGLARNPAFIRQIGDKRNGASQAIFLDTPYLVNRAYTTAMPFLSFAEMFNSNLAHMLADKSLPPDLTWLAPIGTWSCVITPDEEGIQGYSVSGIGNQGILLAGVAGGGASLLQSLGLIPKPPVPPVTSFFTTPPAAAAPGPDAQANPSTALGLPPPTAPQAVPPADATATASVITITRDNKIYFDATPVPASEISDYLKAKKAGNQDLKLLVHADQDSSPDVLSTVMDAGASAGFGVLPYNLTSGAASLPPSPNGTSSSSITTESGPTTNLAPFPTPIADGSPATPVPLQPQ